MNRGGRDAPVYETVNEGQQPVNNRKSDRAANTFFTGPSPYGKHDL